MLNDFLKTFVGPEVHDQLDAVYALQVFCYEKQFPKGTECVVVVIVLYFSLMLFEKNVKNISTTYVDVNTITICFCFGQEF